MMGKNKWYAMRDRIPFGRLSKVSFCFRPSVLYLRQIWASISSLMCLGNWFLAANWEAAWTVSLCSIGERKYQEIFEKPTTTLKQKVYHSCICLCIMTYEWSFNPCLLYMHDPGVLNDWKFMQVPFLLDHLVDLKFDKTNYNYIHAIKLGERNELK